jgi:hypothetical protein
MREMKPLCNYISLNILDFFFVCSLLDRIFIFMTVRSLVPNTYLISLSV